MIANILLLLLLVSATLTLKANHRFVEHEKPIDLPDGWSLENIPQPEQMRTITFSIKLRNEEVLEKHFWSVSDPQSPEYTNYLTLDEMIERYSPHPDDINLLLNWFKEQGINNYYMPATKDFIHVNMTVHMAEKLFDVKLMTFSHPNHPNVIRSLMPYSLPTEIAKIVYFATGINRFPSPQTIKLRSKIQKEILQSSITPQVIWQTFNTAGVSGKNPNNIQSVAQFLQQYFNPTDLAAFQQLFSLGNQPVAKIVGPNYPSQPGLEASLDIEYIMGVARNIPTYFWSTAGLHEGQEPFVQWATDLNNEQTVPFVNSVSYGDDESTITKNFADALNVQFQKLALRGSTILFASGDDGVGCSQSCTNLPNWPATSPFVTAVGGFVGPNPLTADVISSGGFSNYYQMPSYQSAAVTNYLATAPNIPPASQFNRTSRAVPDVSSFSENVIVVQYGQQNYVGGTSCAAPVFSAIISLINDQLLSKGKKTLGFINPALYQIGSTNSNAFLDVTSGNNPNGCCNGFTATTGWDPVTGWGGPNFPNLLNAFSSMQD